MRTRIATAGILLLLSAGACASGSSEGSSDSGDRPEVISKNRKYASVVELRDDYIDADGECDDWSQDDGVSAALESGECGTDTVLSIYVDRAEAKAAATALTEFASSALEEESSVLVGANWIVNNDEDADGLRLLKQKLGGTIVTSY